LLLKAIIGRRHFKIPSEVEFLPLRRFHLPFFCNHLKQGIHVEVMLALKSSMACIAARVLLFWGMGGLPTVLSLAEPRLDLLFTYFVQGGVGREGLNPLSLASRLLPWVWNFQTSLRKSMSNLRSQMLVSTLGPVLPWTICMVWYFTSWFILNCWGLCGL
jgi:hypothetical protein